MRAAFLVALVLVTIASRPTVEASTGPIPLNCDRACLEGVMDQYLAAVVAHDPKRAPLSKDVKYTENDQVMKVGDGFWKTAAGHRQLQALLRRSGVRSGRVHGHDAGGRRAAAL